MTFKQFSEKQDQIGAKKTAEDSKPTEDSGAAKQAASKEAPRPASPKA